MKYFIFRNMTVERFFQNQEVDFSGYEDISYVDETADRYLWFYLFPIAENNTVIQKLNDYRSWLQMIARRIPGGKMLLVCTVKEIFTLKTATSDCAVTEAVNRYNVFLCELAAQNANIKVVDLAGFLDNYAGEERIDWKYYFISQMGLNPRLAVPFQQWFENQIRAIEFRRKKCLVLDLDNTLWGGILGEDGVKGIALGGDYPGKAYRMFQQQILDLSRQGIILAICSKNNLEDVRQLWATHSDAVLKEEHFTALRINWNNKADNIREIAMELNIGLDSLVFVDDNPSEREIVKNYLPEITVPDFPEQAYQLPLFFKKLTEQYFSIYALTEEDKQKTEQYKANAQRADEQRSFTNMEEYIRNLKIELKIAEINDLTLLRASQMTQKTNQFNLTTHRYTDVDLSEMLQNGHEMFTLSVSDKFGDNGITGLCIVQIFDNRANIDSLLLSCRILGKNIENAFLSFILKMLQSKGIGEITASYIPSAKNTQVIDFYDRNGFALSEEDKNGTKHYFARLSDIKIELSTNYTYL